jgi:hypothetical protein
MKKEDSRLPMGYIQGDNGCLKITGPLKSRQVLVAYECNSSEAGGFHFFRSASLRAHRFRLGNALHRLLSRRRFLTPQQCEDQFCELPNDGTIGGLLTLTPPVHPLIGDDDGRVVMPWSYRGDQHGHFQHPIAFIARAAKAFALPAFPHDGIELAVAGEVSLGCEAAERPDGAASAPGLCPPDGVCRSGWRQLLYRTVHIFLWRRELAQNHQRRFGQRATQHDAAAG